MLINNTRFLNETWFYRLPSEGQIILALLKDIISNPPRSERTLCYDRNIWLYNKNIPKEKVV